MVFFFHRKASQPLDDHKKYLLTDASQLDTLIPCDLHLFKIRELVAFSEKVFSLSISSTYSDGPLLQRGA